MTAMSTVAPRTAHAEEVSPSGKGIAGGALLGGEIVVFGEALFGVRNGWAYALGALGGAAAGGVGGHFIEQGVDDGRVPAYLLAGGLALVIPALVIALDQTRYLPAEGARDDRPVQSLPPSDPGQPGGSAVVGVPSGSTPAGNAPTPGAPQPTSPPPTTPPAGGGGGATPGPQSLINLNEGGFYVGVPVPEVRPVFTAAQAKALAVQNTGSELRFPVVRVQF
ncbi:hypothetical protein [Labilithrix luteola]|uniref:hypothetical protein n=1 Tax=Labilithrix luteola TaxID=1391654 RepID=UPI001969A430|nr:hypothetical protein [Labilithrix luteola]